MLFRSNLPKSVIYDGKGSWRGFHAKFTRFAAVNRLNAEENRDCLCLSLLDTASEYHAMVTDQEPDISFDNLMAKIGKRFGNQELPETAMIRFSNAKQGKDEHLDEWVNRVLTLATKAFRQLPDDYMNKQSVLRFCHGLYDKISGESVANMRPISMDDVLEKVKWSKYTRRLIYNKQAQITQGILPEARVAAVTTPMPHSSVLGREYGDQPSRLDGLESRIGKLEDKLDVLVDSIERLLRSNKRNNTKRVLNTSGSESEAEL